MFLIVWGSRSRGQNTTWAFGCSAAFDRFNRPINLSRFFVLSCWGGSRFRPRVLGVALEAVDEYNSMEISLGLIRIRDIARDRNSAITSPSPLCRTENPLGLADTATGPAPSLEDGLVVSSANDSAPALLNGCVSNFGVRYHHRFALVPNSNLAALP